MLMLLTTPHLEILDVFVVVFDGVFHRDAEWIRQRKEIGRFGMESAERFGPRPRVMKGGRRRALMARRGARE